MKNLKEKGITLIALVVTIIILLILAGVTIGQIAGNNGLFKKAREAVDKYQDEQDKEKNGLEKIDALFGNSVKNEEVYEKVKVNKPKLSNGMIPIKYDEEKENWVITNENDEDWYDYSEGKMLWANVMLSDGKYKESNKEYTEDGTTEVKEEDLGSMFVWVPRYAYSINKYHEEMALKEGTTQNVMRVTFLNGTEDKDFEGKSYPREYNVDEMLTKVGQPTPMIVHPGFTFGEEELTGIWVAKFKASMNGTNANTVDGNDKETQNTSSNENCVKILPNADVWRYITVGNSFFNCLNMNGDNNIYGLEKVQADTHLMKNVEFGVVAYLASSQYGTIPGKNNSLEQIDEGGKNVIHIYSGGKDYKTNIKQSTTGNITGIYDFFGGGSEGVAGFYDNLDFHLKICGKNAFTDERQLKTEYAKYWDKYDVSEEEKKVEDKYKNGNYRNYSVYEAGQEENGTRKKMAEERIELMKTKFGDGMFETIGTEYAYLGKNDNRRSLLDD